METPAVNSPKRPGFFRRLFAWRRVRKVLFVLAALITLGALFFAEEDWRGSRAWANYKRGMEAKGESFDAARLIPPKVPDNQNFAMTPLFAPFFELPPEVLRQPIAFQPMSNFITNISPNATFTDSKGRKTPLRFYVMKDPVTNILTQFRLPYVKNQPHRFTWSYGLADDLIPWVAAFQDTNMVAIMTNVSGQLPLWAVGLNDPNSEARYATTDDPVEAASFILDRLKPLETTLAELQSAGARPFNRFNILYEELANPQVNKALLAHLSEVKQLYEVLSLHAEAEMVAGHSDQALQDILLMFRVDDGVKDEPILISQLVRYGSLAVLLHSVGEGLAEQRWNDAQLRVLQERLQKADLMASTVHALYGERDIYINPMFDRSELFPRGWSRLEQLNFNRAFQELVAPCINLTAREINPAVNHAAELAGQKLWEEGPLHALFHHTIMIRDHIQNIVRVTKKTALAQSGVDLAMVACALERYRLARGQYPEELRAMVPDFAAALPHDIINGQLLKYRRTDNGRFLLYSVGWNEKDDGGVAASKGNPPRQDTEQGDWVWQCPQAP